MDRPAKKDTLAIGGNIGPHTRTAKSLAETILAESESDGITIGIEGGWGSGKTTIINILEQELDSHDHITVFSFDAWAHEGDPLRRTYLESLIRHLQDIEWVEKDEWDDELKRLAKREKTTDITTTHSVTRLGKIAGITAFSIPAGIALLTEAFRRGVDFIYCPGCDINWMFVIGCIMAMFPLVSVLSYRIIGNAILRARKKKKRIEFEFLKDKSDSHSVQNTSEDPEPTSIEFEDTFRKLISETADNGHSQRQLVIILDNLDRVNEDDARAIWSTLQTFILERDAESDDQYRRPWIIVPYDPQGIKYLWGKRESKDNLGEKRESSDPDEKDNKITYAQQATRSFLDKSFPLRFEVPPLVLSNWREYLFSIAAKALPDHSHSDFEPMYTVYNLMTTRDAAPTPREIKLFVNQIGVIHRQWQHTYSLGHIACYVALKRSVGDIRKALLSTNDDLDKMILAFPSDLIESLAGLAFNVDKGEGMQLLLGDRVTSMLLNNKQEELADLESRRPEGLWAVLEDNAVKLFNTYNPSEITNTAACLYGAKIFGDDITTQKSNIISRLRTAIRNVESWPALNVEISTGLSASCYLVNDGTMSLIAADAIRVGISAIKIEEHVGRVDADVLGGMVNFFETLEHLGHLEALAEPFELPCDAAGWCAMAIDMTEYKPKIWRMIRPQVEFGHICDYLNDSILTGEFNANSESVIRITQVACTFPDWAELIDAATTRLSADADCSIEEVADLLTTLKYLEDEGSNVGPAFATLALEGHLLHHIDKARNSENYALIALLLLRFLEEVSNGTGTAQPGQAAPGQDYVDTLLGGSDSQILEPFLKLLKSESKSGLLIEIMDKRRCQFIDGAIGHIMTEQSIRSTVFTPDILLANWSNFEEVLKENESYGFSVLIRDLCKETDLENVIMQDATGFNLEHARLYSIICSESSGARRKFKKWCVNGIRARSEDEWSSELEDDGDLLDLIASLRNLGIKLDLQQQYQNALEGYAKDILDEDLDPGEFLVSIAEQLFSASDKELRKALQRDLVRLAVNNQKTSTSMGFLGLYGDEISSADELTNFRDKVGGLFSDLLKSREVVGLQFIIKVLENYPKIFNYIKNKGQVKAFYIRIESSCTEESDDSDEPQVLVNQIAKILGIKPPESDI